MLELDEIRQKLGQCCSIVRDVNSSSKGVRLETSLQYPDGSYIDVFITGPAPTSSSKVRLSDFGHTTSWLLDMNVRPKLSQKRQAFVRDVLCQYEAIQNGGEFVLDCEADQLSIGVLRLAQVCLRIADLILTRR